MKIGVYISDVGKDIDATQVEVGNPGLGGTEYLMLLLAHQLEKYFPADQLFLFSQQSIRMAGKINIVECDDVSLKATVARCALDILIIKNSPVVLRSLADAPVKIIVWSHNYFMNDVANYLYRTPNIAANVFVGKQQYDRYIDHDVIGKSTYIYNMVPRLPQSIQRDLGQKNVLFIGALIPAKGFHVLAHLWKDLLKDVPDAQLYVMGSGKLYHSDSALGPYGLAEAHYEQHFMKDLVDDEGKILDSVHFLGIVKEEKYQYFSRIAVGVINPTARTETFGLGIIEMNQAGIPVVTIDKNGFPDTIKNGSTGYLCADAEEIRQKIVFLLNHPEKNQSLGKQAKIFADSFTPEALMGEWVRLIEGIDRGDYPFAYEAPQDHFRNNLKWFRSINRYLRFTLRLRFLPSLLSFESLAFALLRKIRR